MKKKDSKCWNEGMIRELFSEDDAEVILGIPLTRVGSLDKRVWHYAKSGHYVVNHGYHVARQRTKLLQEQRGTVSGSVIAARWDLIWKSQVQEIIGICVWRLEIEAVPTMVQLARCKVVDAVSCPVCNAAPETSLHCTRDCACARLVCALIVLPLPIFLMHQTQLSYGCDPFIRKWTASSEIWYWSLYGDYGIISDIDSLMIRDR